MPTESTTANENHNRSIDHCLVANTWTQSNPTVFTYTNYSRTYNSEQHRVKPNPLTDTALAKQSTMRQKSSKILWYNCLTQNTIWCYTPSLTTNNHRFDQYRYTYTKQTDTAPEPPWQNDLLNFISSQRVNLGSSVAEYRQSAGMFKQFAEALHTGYQAIRGRAPRHLEITPCSVAAADLAYAFGVKPLAEDLFSSIEALRLKIDPGIYLRYDNRSTRSVSTTKPDIYSSGKIIASDITIRHVKSDSLNVVVKLKSDTRDFNLGSPITWAWELIPYSFVVDWGIGVGQYLENLDILRSVESIKGTRTRREQYTHYAKAARPNYAGTVIKGSWHKYSDKSHQRFLQTTIPLPQLPDRKSVV